MSRASDLANLIASGNTTIFGEAGVTSSDSTGKTTNLQNGLVKAFAYFQNHSSNAINHSLNMSSMVDGGVGLASFTYTNPFSGGAKHASAGFSTNLIVSNGTGTGVADTAANLHPASSISLRITNTSGTLDDSNGNSYIAVGELA